MQIYVFENLKAYIGTQKIHVEKHANKNPVSLCGFKIYAHICSVLSFTTNERASSFALR